MKHTCFHSLAVLLSLPLAAVAAETRIVIGPETAVAPAKTLAEIDRISKLVAAAKKGDPKARIRLEVEPGADPDVAFAIRTMIADPSFEWVDRRPCDFTKGEPRRFIGVQSHDGAVSRGLQKLAEISKTNAFDLVFFGDSITHYWESDPMNRELKKRFSVLNIATAGNRVEHLIWYAEHGFLDGYRAKAMMLMIGTNNGNTHGVIRRHDPPAADGAELLHHDIPGVVPGVKRLLEIVRAKQPDMTVFLLPVLPRHWRKLQSRFEAVNEGLAGLCDGKRVVWCDISEALLVNGRSTDEIFRDGCHLSEKGYQIWYREMLPRFEKVVHAASAPAPERKIRVACIGDSITWGVAMTNREVECYPVQLQRLLGEKYEVRNYGVGGSGVYTKPKRCPSGWQPSTWRMSGNAAQAFAFEPDIVISNLGINNSETFMFEYMRNPDGTPKEEPGLFYREYVDLFRAFEKGGRKPRLIMWTRLAPIGKKHPMKGQPPPFVMEPTLDRVADAVGAEKLDMYTPLVKYCDTPHYANDGVHPEGRAQREIAEITARQILGK